MQRKRWLIQSEIPLLHISTGSEESVRRVKKRKLKRNCGTKNNEKLRLVLSQPRPKQLGKAWRPEAGWSEVSSSARFWIFDGTNLRVGRKVPPFDRASICSLPTRLFACNQFHAIPMSRLCSLVTEALSIMECLHVDAQNHASMQDCLLLQPSCQPTLLAMRQVLELLCVAPEDT